MNDPVCSFPRRPSSAGVAGRGIWLGGPTGSGKSSIALELAAALGGEIVSVDSMQVYRGMDIGTAKPTVAEQQRIPHHLIDLVGVEQEFSVAAFLGEVQKVFEGLRERGKGAILCGGTGLYFKALLQGIGSAPRPDPELRARLEATPLPELLAELRRADPLGWAHVDRNNPRRVVRAVEILRLSGLPVSAQRTQWDPHPHPTAPFFRVERQREDLRQRVDQRVQWMFRSGLVEETQRLLGQGLARNRSALQAIGYRQVTEYLEGRRGLPEAVALVQQRTRTFVRRQRNWFERQLPTEALWVPPGEPPRETAQRLITLLQERGELPGKTEAERA